MQQIIKIKSYGISTKSLMLGFLFEEQLDVLCSYQSTKTQFPIHVYSQGFTEIDDYQKSIKNSRSAHHILPSTKFYFSQQGGDDDDDDNDSTSDNDDDQEEQEDSSWQCGAVMMVSKIFFPPVHCQSHRCRKRSGKQNK